MPTRSSSFFIQGTHGTRGHFEVVIPRAGGGIAHLWRHNDVANFPWSVPAIAFGSTGDVTGVSLIQSNYGPAGNLEVVAREGNRLIHNWRDDGASWRWQQAVPLPGGAVVTGPPALIQSSFGTKGNFEVVAPLSGGGMGHWWRNNDAGGVWNGPVRFGSGAVAAVALLQSNYGSPGNLEVVARVGSELVRYFCDAAGWHGPFPLASGVAGAPSFIQGSFGTRGNFELVSPLAGGGLGHWWRANDVPDNPWRGPVRFGSGTVQAVGLIQSNFASPDGPLEVVARAGGVLQHYYRDGAGWHGPFVIHREAGCPATRGRAEIPFRTGAVAVHMGLARTGKLILWGFNDAGGAHIQSRVLDPATGALQTPTACHHNPHLFCGGQAFLPSGELLVAGGHAEHTIRELHGFDPATQTWVHRGTMARGRWYPTVTALPDGRMLLLSGTVNGGGPHAGNPVNHTTEIFDPATGTVGPENPLPTPFSAHFPASFPTIDLYPFVYVLPTGKVLVHSRNTTRFFNPPAAGTAGGSWDALQLRTVSPVSRSWPGAGTSVLLPLLPSESYRPRVMVIGGAGAEGAALGLGPRPGPRRRSWTWAWRARRGRAFRPWPSRG
ncbi:MAG TPA: hypothetical protein VHG08_17705 [Longimicrobium sp.]|nr:hypothetical protein [Longimicrobium sp.]